MADQDIDRIPKNNDTDIVIRIDDFGGKRGLTIREFVKSERYTGFTKAGTRIPADKFALFKQAINSVDEAELAKPAESVPSENFQKKPFQGKSSSFGNKSFAPKGANANTGSNENKPVDDIDFEDAVM